MLYPLSRKILFSLDPELSHDLCMSALRLSMKGPVYSCMSSLAPNLPTRLWDLDFRSPVGLAAGLDKHADNLDAMASLGFGFIEVGTVTPRPQLGNDKPRLFRLPEHHAILNRFGFNSKGVDHLVAQVKRAKFSRKNGDVVGINIGKNKQTPNEKAIDDYLYCMDRIYEHASYIAINISSPNTPGLRNLQQADMLHGLVKALKERQSKLADQYARYVPITIKIAPDLEDSELTMIADIFCHAGVDGLIATNTTLCRDAILGHIHAEEMGGLSGAPVTSMSTEVIKKLRIAVGPELPIIGVGGIMDGNDAAAKIEAGANLVQLYSGFIYAGPSLIRECVEALT